MLKRIYRISGEGSWNILKSGLYMCLFNLATLLPVLLLAMVANEMMNRYFGITHGNIPLWGYWGTALLLLFAIYFAYRMTYRKKYLTSTKEDMWLRMEIADKIRRLPLSYIGRAVLGYAILTIISCANYIHWLNASAEWLDKNAATYGQDFMYTVSGWFDYWWMLPLVILSAFVGGLIGGLLGRSVLKKHFVRSGLV